MREVFLDLILTFFQATHEVIFNILNKSISGKLSEYSDVAYTLGKYGVSLYVLWYAFTVLARKQQTPVPDFIWNICRFYIILLFVKNTGGNTYISNRCY